MKDRDELILLKGRIARELDAFDAAIDAVSAQVKIASERAMAIRALIEDGPDDGAAIIDASELERRRRSLAAAARQLPPPDRAPVAWR